MRFPARSAGEATHRQVVDGKAAIQDYSSCFPISLGDREDAATNVCRRPAWRLRPAARFLDPARRHNVLRAISPDAAKTCSGGAGEAYRCYSLTRYPASLEIARFSMSASDQKAKWPTQATGSATSGSPRKADLNSRATVHVRDVPGTDISGAANELRRAFDRGSAEFTDARSSCGPRAPVRRRRGRRTGRSNRYRCGAPASPT